MNEVMCSIDWGLVVNALAALGSIGAALAALYIATTDRKERKRERAAGAEAQAKLIVVKANLWNDIGMEAPHYPVRCTNHGLLPILDVRLESAQMRGYPDVKPTLSDSVRALLPGGGEYASFDTSWADEQGAPFPKDGTPNHLNAVDIEAAVSFSDVNGNRWLRSNIGTLKRL
ncbi:hypothetical protein AWC11_11315 [Mycobacterium interjectum]|nr:hypothetical protein AWC11_11315 [Mycobacterium interjectum]